MGILFGILIGFGVWFILRYVLTAFYTVDQNERAVKHHSAARSAWGKR